MTVSKETVIERLKTVNGPDFTGNIVDLGMVSEIFIADGKVLWMQPRVGTMFYASPVRAGDKLFCVDKDGAVVCLAADTNFKELGRTELKEECRSTPAIAGGRLYVRTISHLYSVGGAE